MRKFFHRWRAKAVGYDVSQISFFPYGLLVYLGTYAEFIFPVLILVGLFTRLSAAGDDRLYFCPDLCRHPPSMALKPKSIGAPFDQNTRCDCLGSASFVAVSAGLSGDPWRWYRSRWMVCCR